MITDIVAMFAFAGFVLGGMALLLAGRRPPRARQTMVRLFLLYVLGVSALAGLAQRDLWPFSAWSLVAGNVPEPWATTRLVAVDAEGREHRIDARAFEPLSLDELRGWLLQEFPRLAPAGQDRVLADLLERVNAARARVAAGGRPGTNARYLGPLAAPLFLLHPRSWSSADDVPAGPFAGIRYYQEVWTLDPDRQRGPAVRRALVREIPSGAAP